MKKFALIMFILVFLFVGSYISYMKYCENVSMKIYHEFTTIFVDGISKSPNENDKFYDLKKKLYDRQNQIITIYEEIKFNSENERIEYYESMERETKLWGISEKSSYLLYDTREVIEDVGEIIENDGYYYSNSANLYLKDIPFKNGYCEIVYNEFIVSVFKEDFPISYSDIIDNPAYNFHFVNIFQDFNDITLLCKNDLNEEIDIVISFKYFFKPIIELNGLNI